MTAWAARENFRDSRVTDFTPTKHQSLESSPSKAKRKSKKGVYIPNIKLTNEGNKTNVNFQPGEGVQFVLQPELVSHLRHTGSGMKHDITVGTKNLTKDVHDFIKGFLNGVVTTDKHTALTDIKDITDQLFDVIIPDIFRPIAEAIKNFALSLGGGVFGPLISMIATLAIYILPPMALVATLLGVTAIAIVAAFAIGEAANGPEIWDSEVYEAFISPTDQFQGGFQQGGFQQGGIQDGGFQLGGIQDGGFQQDGFQQGGIQGGFNPVGGNQGGFNPVGGFNGNRRSSYSSYNRRSDDLSNPILLTKTGSDADHLWNTIDGSSSSFADRSHRSLHSRSHVSKPLLNRIAHRVVNAVHKYQKMYEDYQKE